MQEGMERQEWQADTSLPSGTHPPHTDMQQGGMKPHLMLGFSKPVIKRQGSSLQFLYFFHIQSCQRRVSSIYEIFNSHRF